MANYERLGIDGIRSGWQPIVKTQHCPNCEATEQKLHDFRQEVSDVAEEVVQRQGKLQALLPFIIPAPKPDPLEEVLSEIDHAAMWVDECAKEIRASLDTRGFEIRKKG